MLSELLPPPAAAETEAADGKEAARGERRLRHRHWQWARPQVEGLGPSARGGHTATLVGGRVVVFGGHCYAGQGADVAKKKLKAPPVESASVAKSKGFEYFNDVHVLDVDANQWIVPRCRGTPPQSRYGHSATLVGSRIVIFGGRGIDDTHFRDLHALETVGSGKEAQSPSLDPNTGLPLPITITYTWYQGPCSGGTPLARMGHSCSLFGSRLFIFGGVCGTTFFGDLHCLDLASMAWSIPETIGPRPSPRTGHAALMVGEKLVIHGGLCAGSPLTSIKRIASSDTSGTLLCDCYLNDMRVLDIPNLVWSRIRTTGTPPAARYGHTMMLSDEDILIYGGWGGGVKRRFGGGGKSITGGSTSRPASQQHSPQQSTHRRTPPTEEKTADDISLLRLGDMRWCRPPFVGSLPAIRYGHSCTVIGPHLVIVGGWDGGKPLNDILVFRDRAVDFEDSMMGHQEHPEREHDEGGGEWEGEGEGEGEGEVERAEEAAEEMHADAEEDA
ncbi:unnamed protein product [Vitrella brassicaformis CCMP3155]|uniref:Uncharacterized protein n=2 Tax=Vitrella brassicaformis TaxID=1169539 RepID=A0A0G4FL10_VITBC|nr:unnamed protein product [Vitrella brassicaformis CCMP3155]|eukprot:CEM14663.1 unnamed protein product [Vitrella brassicaformis CCMP3155]